MVTLSSLSLRAFSRNQAYSSAVADKPEATKRDVYTRWMIPGRRPQDYQIYTETHGSFLRELATMVLVCAFGLTGIVFVAWIVSLLRG